MNISKLNPIGYKATTEKGNTYKKSNLGKSAMLVGGTALTVLAETSKNEWVKGLSTKSLVKDLNIKNPKLAVALGVAGLAFDLVFYYLVGKWIDKKVNAKRAAKADLQA